MRASFIQQFEVYKRAHGITLELYRITRLFPVEERFGLVSQIRRAASSVGANLMEGSHRRSRAEFARFVSIASGSCAELKYHLLLSKDLKYIGEVDYDRLCDDLDAIAAMLYGLYRRLCGGRVKGSRTQESGDRRQESGDSDNS